MAETSLSIVLPAKNEAEGLARVLPSLREKFPHAEIIVVDDGSTDDTRNLVIGNGVRLLSHPYSMGNGAAIKTGARAASGQILVFMDADGQHDAADISRLLEMLEQGYDMVVGARGQSSQANLGRLTANMIYNKIASWMVNRKIPDLTSGLRAARAEKFREFIHLLPNGFSYPTTSTMAFFRAGYPVGYVPINAARRIGKSHLRPVRDGIRFFLIIFRIGTLYSPLKLFLPISLASLLLGIGYYSYTFVTTGRFTNMSALLFITSILIFLIGLVAEQITMLMYQNRDR